jgi:hypothetical protein
MLVGSLGTVAFLSRGAPFGRILVEHADQLSDPHRRQTPPTNGDANGFLADAGLSSDVAHRQ